MSSALPTHHWLHHPSGDIEVIRTRVLLLSGLEVPRRQGLSLTGYVGFKITRNNPNTGQSLFQTPASFLISRVTMSYGISASTQLVVMAQWQVHIEPSRVPHVQQVLSQLCQKEDILLCARQCGRARGSRGLKDNQELQKVNK